MICLALGTLFVLSARRVRGDEGTISPWPSSDEALRAAAVPVLDFIDSIPGLMSRSCEVRLSERTGDRATLKPLIEKLLSEHEFVAVLEPTGSFAERPVLVIDHERSTQGGVVRVKLEGLAISGSARYEEVFWAVSSTYAVESHGRFIVAVGRSRWSVNPDHARADALRDASRSLALHLTESAGGSVAVDRVDESLRQASRDDFLQRRERDGEVAWRIISRFVLSSTRVNDGRSGSDSGRIAGSAADHSTWSADRLTSTRLLPFWRRTWPPLSWIAAGALIGGIVVWLRFRGVGSKSQHNSLPVVAPTGPLWLK